MSRIHGHDTKPEIVLRKALHADGFRFRVNVRQLPGKPDIVLKKYNTAIFVNGCFWHGHEGCRYYTVPKSNVEFWTEKVKKNKERDRSVNGLLESQGWYVITVWECELKKARLTDTIQKVEDELSANLERWFTFQEMRKQSRLEMRELQLIRKESRQKVESELSEQFKIPIRIKKLSKLEEE